MTSPDRDRQRTTMAQVRKIDAILQRVVACGPPRILDEVPYGQLQPGDQSQAVVLRHSTDCLVVLAVPSGRDAVWMWLQVGDKICCPLFGEPTWLVVPRHMSVCVNRWRPSEYLGPIEPGHVELYGWELADCRKAPHQETP